MPSAVTLRDDYSAEAFGRWPDARGTSTRAGGFCRWLRFETDGPAIGGEDRWHGPADDWVHRFNASSPDGLIDNWTEGPSPVCRKSSWPSSPGSSRLVRIARGTAS